MAGQPNGSKNKAQQLNQLNPVRWIQVIRETFLEMLGTVNSWNKVVPIPLKNNSIKTGKSR